ncbi:hypothetical protein VaNZ11_013738, partial [Volvox africanus]
RPKEGSSTMPSADAGPRGATASAISVPAAHILRILQRASREVRDLDLGRSVDRVASRDLSPLRFATEYVQRNKPVVITDAINGWPALRLWGERYLESHPAGEVVVTVDVTPNGRGDAITTVADNAAGRLQEWFVTPHERRMTLKEFFGLMRKSRGTDKSASKGRAPREVPYMQHQNSNLSGELGLLLDDIGPGLPWAEEVFGGPPEAMNIWIGDERSATSFHKDHYENLYAVIRGTKVFSLLPPCDAYRMYLTRCPAASYMPRRDVLRGAVYGEVSPQPGVNPTPRAAIGASAVAVAGGGGDGEATDDTAGADDVARAEAEEEAGNPSELVAVLRDPGYEVLWSAVDTTVQDPKTRQAQPLFFGLEGGGLTSPAEPGVRSDGGDSGGLASPNDNSSDYADTALRRGLGSDSGQEIVDTAGGVDVDRSCSTGGCSDPWDTAGGAPLVVEVGPGEVLYLPSLWYHQVEQYTAAKRAPSSRPGGNRAAAPDTAAATTRPGAAGGTAADNVQGQQPQAQKTKQAEEEEYVMAVNFWYDMKYDGRYSAFKLVEGLAMAMGLADKPPAQEAGGHGHS